MKKLLIALFIVLIMAIGIVGYTQTMADKDDIIHDNRQNVTIES